jgi:hypothetical protein
VQTNEQIHFTRLEEALTFIGRYVDLGDEFVVIDAPEHAPEP